MNIFEKEDIKKARTFSRDGAYRDGDCRIPVQPIMSFRFGAGSDTIHPEMNRQVLDVVERRPANTKTNPYQEAPFYMTGGVRRTWPDKT